MSIDQTVKEKPKYQQPHNIHFNLGYHNPALYEHLRLKEHARQKYDAMYNQQKKGGGYNEDRVGR